VCSSKLLAALVHVELRDYFVQVLQIIAE
jgi:hypothetical protein